MSRLLGKKIKRIKAIRDEWNVFLSTSWCKDLTPLYLLYFSYLYEPEGNACSLTDTTAEEHVLALVEHSADEARDRINRYMPSSKVLY